MDQRREVLLGGFSHESNTFSPLPMRAEEFWVYQGDFTALESLNGEYAGAIRQFSKLGYQPVPIIAAGATVGGVIERQLLDTYLEGMEEELSHVDVNGVAGILWVLHGSSMVSGVKDVQARILKVLRCRFPDTPLVISMDLHSTITATLLQLVDGLVHYQTAPHRDILQTGERAARMLDHLIASKLETQRLAIKLPLLLPGEFGQTDSSIMTTIYHAVQKFAASTGALDVSLSQGFPWADNPDGVVSIVGIWTRKVEDTSIRQGMRQLAHDIWDLRHGLYNTLILHSIADIGASETARRSTVYCDSGDNPTAGAPEDRIDVLAYVLQQRITGVLFFPIVDAPFVAYCAQCQRGASVNLRLGGTLSGTRSLTVQARVLRTGRNDRMGNWVVAEIADNVVVVTERRFGISSPSLLDDCGFDVHTLPPPNTMVLKSGYLFPDWEKFLVEHHWNTQLLATEGSTTLKVDTLPYKEMPSNYFPLAEESVRMMEIYVTGRSDVSCEVVPLK